MHRILSITTVLTCILCKSPVQGEQIPFVTCRISGQLANNLNQIATTLAYAWDYGADPFFPELNKSEWNISYNRDRFFFRLNYSFPPRGLLSIYNEYAHEGGWWECNQIPFQPDQYLSGDFFLLETFSSLSR